MAIHSNDIQDERITRWLESLKHGGCSEDRRFSLLCPALDALLEQFEQEHGPISNISSNSSDDRTSQEAPPNSDVQRQEQKPGTDESQSETECHENRTDTTVIQPDPGSEQLRLAVLSIMPSTSVYKTAADSQSGPDSNMYTAEKLAVQPHSKNETAEGTRGAPGSEQLAVSSNMSSTTSQLEAPNDRQETEKRMKRKRKHRQNHDHVCSKKARQENNYSSLDARLEQFYVCPQTNRLIPKLSQNNVESAPDCSRTAEHSDNARLTSDAVRDRETDAKHRKEKVRTRHEMPRPRGFRKSTSLLKKALTRCLIRKALETGTFCCYRRCFLTKRVIYI